MKQKLFILQLAMIAPLAGFAAVGDTFTEVTNNITLIFTIVSEDDNTCKIINSNYDAYTIGEGWDGFLSIPGSVSHNGKNYSVTEIGNGAFNKIEGLKSLTIPSSIITIDGANFSNSTDLSTVTFHCKTIQNGWISGITSINEIVIGDEVTDIGDYAFQSCSGLTTIIIGAGVTSLGNSAFEGCISLNRININCSAISPESGMWFANTDVREVVMGDNVSTVGNRAFSGCRNLESVTIASNVVSIGEAAFANCEKLTSIFIENGNTEWHYTALNGCTALSLIKVEYHSQTCKSISGLAPYTGQIKEIFIGNEVTTIEEGAFYRFGITEVNIPNSVTSICDGAFSECNNLKSVTIPASVASVGVGAFSCCSLLNSVTINCKDVEVGWFSGSPIEELILGEGVEIIAENAFRGCEELSTLAIPSTLAEVGEEAFSGCSGLSTVRINCKKVGDWFAGLTALKTVVIGDQTEIILNRGFANCSALESVTLGESVTTIGESAFYKCGKLNSINIPQNLKVIGDYAFYNSGIKTFVIPVTIESIGIDAFSGCGDLSTVEFHSTEIGDWFSRLESLKEVTMGDKVASIGEDAFSQCSSLESVTIGKNVINIGISAFSECKQLKSIIIPDNVISVDEYAFYGCSGLTSVTFPKNVTSIGVKAFRGCTSLSSFALLASEPFEINENVFDNNVYQNATLYVPYGSKSKYEAAGGWKNFVKIEEVPNNPETDQLTNIVFADDAVKALCVANWDTNGDGELSKSEAAAVTDIGTVFKENNTITSLDELRFFTGLTKIEAEAFFSSSITSVILPETVTEIGAWAFRFSGLKSITLPAALTTVGEMAFYNCYLLMEVTSLNPNPTAMPNLEFYTNDVTLYVPSGSKALYEAADGWKSLTHIVDPAEGEQVFEAGGLKYYKLADGSVCVIDGQHVSGDCSIPVTVSHGVTDYPVSMISCGAFSGNKALTSVVIPQGVTNIGSFESCSNLVTATLPKSIAPIDMFRQFWDCSSLVSLDIPEGVTEFEESAFSSCVSLTSVTLPKSLIKSHRYAFRNCEKLSDVHILDVSLWSSIDFRYGNTDSGSIPTSNPLRYAKNIYLDQDREPSAKHGDFGDVSAKTLYVLKGCKEAYQNAEFWKDFGEIKEMEGEISSVIIAFADANVEAICVANWDADGDGEFSFAEAAAVTDIGEQFKGTDISSFDEFQFFEGVTTIPQNAFNECRELTSIKLPKTVTSIGNYAFCYCGKLTSITIPAAVVSFGAYEFEYCNSLSEMIVEEGNAVYDSRNDCNAIIYTPSNMLLYGCKNTVVPEDVVNISSYAFYAIETLESIYIPASVMTVSGRSFDGCSSLSAISVSKDNTVYDSRNNCNAIVKTETNELIAGCNNTVIPKDVVSIQTFAFSGRSVGKVTVPGNVKTIADYAFNMCPALTEVEFDEGVAEIGENAFQSCDALETVSLPSTVTTIKSRAFIFAPLKFVVSEIRIPFELPNDALSSYRYDTAVLYVPVGTKSLYEQAEGWKNFKTIEEIVLMPMKDMSVVDFGEDGNLNENTDLGGTVIDNVYFNISPDNGGYDATDNSVVLSKPMTDEEIATVFGNDQKDLFSDEVKNNFAGMVVEVPVGKGVVTVEAQTTGGLTLKVKIGNADPVEVEFEGKLKLRFPYDVTEPTYAYIFAGETQASVRARTRGETPSLRIYGISVNRNVIPGDANGDGVVNYSDVVAVLDRIIGGTSGKFVEAAADVNNDGQITIADALGILDIISKEQ